MEREDMSRGEIGDVDIVAYRSAVRRVEVIPENCEVANMPLQGRNWVTLLKIIPGSNATSIGAFSGREYTSTGYADFRINGKNPGQTQVNLDGGSIDRSTAAAAGARAKRPRPWR